MRRTAVGLATAAAAALAAPVHANADTPVPCPRVAPVWHHDGAWHARNVLVEVSQRAITRTARGLPVMEGSRTTPAEVPCGIGFSVASQMGAYWTHGYGIANVFWRAEGVAAPLGEFRCTYGGKVRHWTRLTCRQGRDIAVTFQIGPS